MRQWVWIAALVAIFAASSANAANAGFETIAVPVAGDRPLAVGVWYPTAAPEADARLGLVRQSVATGAAITPGRHPLVVISHGTGGWYGDHYVTARTLARAGFVVAAVSHTGDTFDDHSRTLRATERPGHLVRLVDHMTATWRNGQAVDAGRIGAFGFSAGGFTVLAALGGEPDLTQLAPHCRAHPHFYDCVLQRTGGPMPSPAPIAREPRIRAAVVAAPALGFTFAPAGLAKVTAPIQLWRAEWDTVLPQPHYAETVRGLLPGRVDYRIAKRADHFDFLPPCAEAMAKAAPQICVGNLDRAAFQAQFNGEVVRFFERTLR